MLTLAKIIADNPTAHTIDQLRDARSYLENTRRNGGVRKSERASARLEQRLTAIDAELSLRLGEGE